MANNEERYCNHCERETTFYLGSDLIWECDDCGNPFGSQPIMDTDSQEFEDALEEFEEENGESIYCTNCGNFSTIKESLENEVCPICAEELDEAQLENKGYEFDEKKAEWFKAEEEDSDDSEEEE
jgi:ribosomal protein L37AE/L43A